MIVLKNARLVSYLTEDCPLETADIVIDGKEISGIYPTGTDFGDCEKVDLAGKTVLPGILDLHMHLHFDTMDSHLKKPYEYIISGISYAEEFLRQGFTTIRSCGDPYGVGFAVRQAERQGIVKAPRIFTSGGFISPTARGGEGPGTHFADGAAELQKACREEYAEGADFLKYMGTGSVASAEGEPGALICTREEMFTLQSMAEALGTYAAVHCHGKSGIMLCAEAGIRTIEHVSYIDDECIELILKKGGKSAIIPTLGPIGLLRGGMFKNAAIAKKAGAQPVKKHKMLDASRAGILTGWGTDVSQDYYTENPGSEFALRSERGYTNQEILQQATINSAKIIGLEDRLGTVKVGKLADLIVVDGKPDEDISVMYKHPYAVYKEGRRYF